MKKIIFAMTLLIEVVVVLMDAYYVRKGRLYSKTISGEIAIEDEITLGERFTLPRGTYMFRVWYDHAGEGSDLVIRNHDVEEGGRSETVLALSQDATYAKYRDWQQYHFATSDFEIIVRPGEGAALNIERVEITQTSWMKKLDFIRIVFWMFIFDCLVFLPRLNRGTLPVSYSNRIMWIEILRIIGSIGVVMLHTAAKGIRNDAILYESSFIWFSIYHTITRFAVPCFFMISGANFLNPKKEITIENLLKKYVPKVAVMYVLWSAVYAIYEMFFEDDYIYITMDSFWSKLLRGAGVLWFLGALAGLYLLTPVLRKIAEEAKLLRYVIALCMIFTFLPPTISIYPTMSSVVIILDKFCLPACYVGYYLIGYYIYEYPVEGKKKYALYICGIVAMIYSIIGGIVYSRSLGYCNTTLYDNYCLNVVLLSSALFTFVKNVVSKNKLSEKWRQRIIWLSGKTAGIYMVHMLVSEPVYDWLLHCGYRLTWFTIPLATVVTFLLSLVVVTAINRIPIARKWLI